MDPIIVMFTGAAAIFFIGALAIGTIGYSIWLTNKAKR